MSMSTCMSSLLPSKLKKREADATSGRHWADDRGRGAEDLQMSRIGERATAVKSCTAHYIPKKNASTQPIHNVFDTLEFAFKAAFQRKRFN